MAVPAGTFQTFQQIGIREDLTDEIHMISPKDTPFYSGIRRNKATAMMHEWQTDVLDTPSTNSQVDGDDASSNTATPTIRLRNYVQSLTKVPHVTENAQAVDTAGREDEMDYQLMKRGAELKKDLEYAMIRNQASSAGSATVPARMAGVESWLTSNRTSAGQGTAQTTPGYSGGSVSAPTDSTTAGTVTEALLRAVILSVYTNGGDGETIMVGPAMKNKITDFSGIATRFREVPSGRQAQITSGVDLYVSNFGEHKIVPNRVIAAAPSRDKNILVLTMRMWKASFLIPFTTWDLAKTGASRRKQLYCSATLEACNEAASGKVTDANPAL
jgi:Family of unknown function (DUF5309)